MDMGNGNFGEISEKKFQELTDKNVKGVFAVGEEIIVKGSLFKVIAIGTQFLTLEILPS